MRYLLALLIGLSIVLPAIAADRPANLQPVPEPSAIPGIDLDPALEPQVTIIKRGTDTISEYRIGGRLYMLKVTPARGPSYYLIDEKGDGRMTRQDSFDSGIRPPMWLLHSW